MFKVHEYNDLASNFWLPDYYYNNLHIIPDDSGELAFPRDKNKPLVVIEHGLHDSTQIYYRTGKMYSQLYADYYLCATKESCENLSKLAKNAYYTGSTIVDFSLPNEEAERDLFVYIPNHGVRIDPEQPLSKNNVIYKSENITEAELDVYTKLYNCTDFVVSKVADDIRSYPNEIISNRYDHTDHFTKLQYLLSRAKVVYENPISTFGIIAHNLGIQVLPTHQELRTTYTDGDSRQRIMEKLNEIIKKTKGISRYVQ